MVTRLEMREQWEAGLAVYGDGSAVGSAVFVLLTMLVQPWLGSLAIEYFILCCN